jgi:hypothetical protein
LNRRLRTTAAAAAGSALLLLAAPTHAVAQTTQATRCLRTYQDQLFSSSIGPVVVYTPPETVTLYPGNATVVAERFAGATVSYANCVIGGLS